MEKNTRTHTHTHILLRRYLTSITARVHSDRSNSLGIR